MPHTTSLIVHIACIYISVGAAAEDSPTKTVAGQNVFGAVLFFSYIVAALVISNLIVADICTVSSSRYRASGLWPEEVPALNEVSLAGQKDEQVYQRAIGNQIKSRILFPVAASISFTVLSWNMLHFLVVCYQAWTTGHGIPLFYRLRTVADLYYQSKQVWAWATDSTLFQTFAEDLLSSPGTWKRVRLSLLYSYGCNLWMSMLGEQLNSLLPLTSSSANLDRSAIQRASFVDVFRIEPNTSSLLFTKPILHSHGNRQRTACSTPDYQASLTDSSSSPALLRRLAFLCAKRAQYVCFPSSTARSETVAFHTFPD